MINGTGAPSGGGSPATAVYELISVLREARRAQRENEMAHAESEVHMAEEQVRLARDKAEAARGQAWLRFSMSVGESLSSMTGAITQGCRTGREDRQSLDQSGEVPGERPHRDSHRDIDNRDVDRVVGLTCEAFRASDEAFGFGERIRRAETDGAELEARAETSKTLAT